MENDFQKSLFYRSLMTCVFVGIVGTLLTMFLDLIFVESFHFPLSDIINVSTLIFGVNLIFLVIGFMFYGFLASSKFGEIIYIIVFVLITAFLIWKMQGIHRSDDDEVNHQFRLLSSGLILIMGLLASVAVPVLFHNKKFDEHVL